MKKLKVIIPLILILMAIVATPVLASDITDAKWTGDIKVTNAGTAASGVATVFDLDEDILISGNYILNDLSNLAIRDPSGADAAYMPGWDANPWCLHVPSIGAGGIQNYRFYAGGSTPMGGKLAYFPGADISTNDKAALELGDDFEIGVSRLIDATAVGQSIFYKSNAYDIFISSAGKIAFNHPALSKKDSYSSTASTYDLDSTSWRGQTITPSADYNLQSVTFAVNDTVADPVFHLRATSGDTPTGGDLVTVAGVSTSSLVTFILPEPYPLLAATKYALIISASASGGQVYGNSSGTYAGGSIVISNDGGATWTNYASRDHSFACYSEYLQGDITTGDHIVRVSSDGTDLKLYIDGDEADSIALGGVSILNNSSAIVCPITATMPYIYYYKITVSGDLQQHIGWQYAASITDQSGQGNNPTTATFRTTSSDEDVTGTFANLRPMAAAVATYTPGGAPELITTPPEMPDNMYDEDYDNIPGAAVVNALLDAGNIPRTFFWFPAIILLAIAVGFGVCVLTRSLMGMALSMTAVIVIFSFMGPIPFWVIIPFGLFALAIIIKRENPGGF